MNSSLRETNEYIFISEPQVDSFYSEIVKSCDPVSVNIESLTKESKYESIIPVLTTENLDESDIIHEIEECRQEGGANSDEIEGCMTKNEKIINAESDGSSEGFRCHVCSYLLPSSRTLRHHLVKTHAVVNALSYFCPLCEQECWSEKQLNYHLNLHHGIKRADLACNVCGMELSSKSEVKAHQRKHLLHYRCPSCSMKFGAKHLLLLHLQDHIAKLKPYACCLCGRRFKHVKAYFLHEWRHSRQTCCEARCKSEFEDESYFLSHLQKVHRMKDLALKNIVSTKDELDRTIDFLLCLSSKKNIIKYIDVQNGNEDNYFLFYFIIETDEIAFTKKENWEELKWKMRNDGELSYDRLCRLKEQLEEIVLNYNIKEEKSIFEDEAEVIELENLLYRRQSKHTCGLCSMSFTSFELYQNHLYNHKKTFKCHSCSRSYRSLKLLRWHCTLRCSKNEKISLSDETMIIKCPECGKLCSSEKALHVHKELKHRVLKKPKCRLCQKSFTTKGHLNEHMYIYHKDESANVLEKNFICTICDKALISEKNLALHMRLHDERSIENEELVSLSCPKCDKKFTRPQMLNHHFRQHNIEHKCSVCGKRFPSLSKLSSHLNSHDHEMKQRFACKHCPLKFSYKCQLRIHELTHTGEKPYVCEKCGKRFKRLQQCKVHNKLVHSEKELQCIECLRFFGTESNLLRHRIAYHMNLKRWICGICSHSYGYSQDLRNHLRKIHQYDLKGIGYKSKKSNNEVYIIPELNSHKIPVDVRQKIEFIHREESLKLQAFILNKDAPSGKGDLAHAQQMQRNESSYPAQNGFQPAHIQATLPSAQIPNPHPLLLIENNTYEVVNPHITHKENATVSRCNYCKLEITDKSKEVACDICSLIFCSISHSVAHCSAGHVLFHCSVCSSRFISKDLCENHIRNSHSYANHLQKDQYIIQPVSTNIPLATIPQLRPVMPNPNSLYQLVPVANYDGSMLNLPAGQDHNYVIQVEGIKPLYQAFSVNCMPEQTIHSNIINQQSLILIPSETAALPVTVLPSTNAMNTDGDKILKVIKQPTYCQVPIVQNQTQVIDANLDSSNQNMLIPSTRLPDCEFVPGAESSEIARTSCSFGPYVHAEQQKDGNPVTDDSAFQKVAPSEKKDPQNSTVLFACRSEHRKLDPAEAASVPARDKITSMATSFTSHDTNIDQKYSENKKLQNQGNTILKEESKDDGDDEDEDDDDDGEEEEENENEELETKPTSLLDAHKPEVDLNSLILPAETHASRVFYKCRVCDKLFPTLQGLERHNKIHNTKKFDCPQCKKSFVEKFNLKTHMLIHTKERPWQCQKCDKRFRYCRDLKDHLRAHEGLLLFQCPSCDLKFLRSRDLVRHKKEQHALVKYKCNECGQEFGRKYYLEKYHMKIHRKDSAKEKQSYDCSLCSKVFSSDESLKAHKCPSSESAIFKCDNCDKRFKRKRSLSLHLRIHNLIKK